MSADTKEPTSPKSVAALKQQLALNPQALLPGNLKQRKKSSTEINSALDPKAPSDCAQLIQCAKDLEEKAATLQRAQNHLNAVNKSLRADIDLYSRTTLPHAVMTKFDRDSSGSGMNELAELKRVAHRRSDSGTWSRLTPEDEARAKAAEAEQKKALGVDKIFRSGWMYKEGGLVRSWKRRLFILYSNSIEYYTSVTDESPKGVITLDTCTISPVQSRDGVDKPCMELVFSKKGRKWRFVAERVSDNRRWFSAIHNRIVTLSYAHRCEQVKEKPDPRILDFLNTVPTHATPTQMTDKPSNKGPTKAEEWPASHPLVLNGKKISLDSISVVARILSDSNTCPGGGVSRLECVDASLTPLELEVLCKALADSDFNVVDNREKERSGSADFKRQQTATDLAPDYKPSEEHGVSCINFSRNTFVGAQDKEKLPAVDALCKVLRVSTRLTELNLQECKLGDAGVEIIATAFPTMQGTLRRLVLSGNNISDKGAIALSTHLAKGIALRQSKSPSLSAASGDVSDSGVTRSPSNQFRVHTLEELTLDRNMIADEGAVAISKFLAVDKCALLRVFLHFNKIADKGIIAVAEAMRVNASIKFLDLSQNVSSGPAAGAALTHMAQINSSLVELRFGNYVLTEPSLNAMRVVAAFGLQSQQN